MGKMTSYQRPDGKSVSGYLAEPAQGPSASERKSGAPGLVVIHEAMGLNVAAPGRLLGSHLH